MSAMSETEASFSFLIPFANAFGIFPLSHKVIADRKQFCFKWKSFRAIHSLLIICMIVANIAFDIHLMIQKGLNFRRVGNFTKNTYK